MPLISQESLARDFWVHTCSAKDGATVHTQNGQACFFCSLTEQQTEQAPPAAEE